MNATRWCSSKFFLNNALKNRLNGAFEIYFNYLKVGRKRKEGTSISKKKKSIGVKN